MTQNVTLRISQPHDPVNMCRQLRVGAAVGSARLDAETCIALAERIEAGTYGQIVHVTLPASKADRGMNHAILTLAIYAGTMNAASYLAAWARDWLPWWPL